MSSLACFATTCESNGRSKYTQPNGLLNSAGEPLALGTIGFYLSIGKGVPRNAFEAVRWYRRAIEKGHIPSMTGLGHMYLDGEGGTSQSVAYMCPVQTAEHLPGCTSKTKKAEISSQTELTHPLSGVLNAGTPRRPASILCPSGMSIKPPFVWSILLSFRTS